MGANFNFGTSRAPQSLFFFVIYVSFKRDLDRKETLKKPSHTLYLVW